MRTRAGDVLAPLEIEITRTLVVAGAIASRDYQDVHHDPELARWRGSPDVFMNILTTNGLVGRYVTDHFGSAAVLRKVAIRLGAPNYPGDTMVLTGTVETADGRTVTVRIIGENGIGRHVTGTVTVTLPDVDVDVDVDAEAEAHAQAHGAASSSVEDAVGSVPARTTGDVE
ncbi:MaoC/PaaZ C-terminal domain-containing protein [Streptomyces europaeiscabiei]|nr:MaoC/PaaZ C-terminal domain-containing protein [Streptomyces europaeiscabiei]